MTRWLKVGIVEQDETAIVRQWHGRCVSIAMNSHAAIEELLEAVFSLQFLLKLYSKNQGKKLLSRSSESAVSSQP
jgi:ribosome-interacting GTPase 1